jgi:putative ABC transport system ATP-binding protein
MTLKDNISTKPESHDKASAESLVSLSGVSRFFKNGRVVALQDVDLVIDRHDFVAVVGRSGGGKSTLLQLMSGLDSPSAGRVCFEGNEPRTPGSWSDIRARKIGFIFQTFHLLPTLNVLQNVEIPMFGVTANNRERRERARYLVKRVGLSHRTHHYPAELSGGECQRVAIARSLANAPELILADEPTGNLDSGNSREIMTLLEEIHVRDGATLVLVTHDRDLVSSAKRCIELVDGRIVGDNRLE